MILFVGILILSCLNINLGNGYTYIIQILIMCTIPLLFYTIFISKNTKKTFRTFGFKNVNYKMILISILLGVCLYILNVTVANMFSSFLYFLGYEPLSITSTISAVTTSDYINSIFLIAVLPAVCEEIAHRGLLLNATKEHIGVKKSLIFSSVLFGLLHLNIEQFFYASVLGCLIGIASLLADSIIPCIILHFMNNFLSVTSSFLYNNNYEIYSIETFISNIFNTDSTFSLLVISSILLLAAIYCCLWCFKMLNKFNIERKMKHIRQYLDFEAENKYSAKEYMANFLKEKQQEAIQEKKYNDIKFKYKIPLYTCIFLGATITCFTFIWGII